MKDGIHLMIDLETLSTHTNGVVLSIGACFFDINGVKQKFYTHMNYLEQECMGRSILTSTLNWWETQEEINGITRPGDSTVNNAEKLLDFKAFCVTEDFNTYKVWSNGASFDVPMIESLMRSYQLEPSWKFWNVRDVRTIVDLYPACRYGGDKAQNNHNALDDAVNQAHWVIKFLDQLED